MKYFIDIEATQYNQEIIAIACIKETGEKFYSLVKPKKIKNVSRFITELTGITKEMVQNERESDEVFEELYDWIAKDNELSEFYCYGNADIDFLKNNLKSRTHTLKAQAALSIIAFSLINYDEKVKDHFDLTQQVALKKVVDYYYPNNNFVCHNALEDAEMLRQVYIALNKEKKVKGVPFPDYVGIPVFRKSEDYARFRIQRYSGDKLEDTYETLEEAAKFVLKQLRREGNKTITVDRLCKKITNAINHRKEYFAFSWKVVVRRDS